MTVVNKNTHTTTPDDVYIGRGSRWGNPYIIGTHGNRAQVIERYERRMRIYLGGPGFVKWVTELLTLEGKNLVCYCAPQACHGDVLEKLIEELSE